MNVEQEQIVNNLDIKVEKLKRKFGNEDGAKELIELFEDYKENGTTEQELKLLWEDIHNYLDEE